MDQLTTTEAIGRIRECAQSGLRVLGLDGFELDGTGYIARLDLLLDLSSQEAHLQRTPASLADEAESFVRAHAAANIVWEVVVDA